MNSKTILWLFWLLATFHISLSAQQNRLEHKKYSVVTPNNYNSEGKNHPLLVCFKHPATNSLLKTFAGHSQTIILELNSLNAHPFETNTIKAFIQKTRHEFRVEKDKIYLLAINQNIGKTAKLREELSYYFAASAYITDHPNSYSNLKDSLKLYNNVQLFLVNQINLEALDTANKLFKEHYLWSLDQQKIMNDAIKLNFEKPKAKNEKNQMAFGYGQWYFNPPAKSETQSLIEFPKNLAAWQLSYSRFLTPSLAANLNIGLLIKTIRPNPDLASVLNGSPIDAEGGGLLLMPLSLGIDYYYLKGRFKPFTGIGVGVVPAQFRYIEASGDVASGIERNEKKFKSQAAFLELSAGFMYQTGENIAFGLNADYIQSTDFNKNIGGYNAFTGFKISVGFAFGF